MVISCSMSRSLKTTPAVKQDFTSYSKRQRRRLGVILPTRPVAQRGEHLQRGVVQEAQDRRVQARGSGGVPPPADGVVHALLALVAQLVQLHVVVDEGVGEKAEHQQHEGLGRAVQDRAEAAGRHHQQVLAGGEPELDQNQSTG